MYYTVPHHSNRSIKLNAQYSKLEKKEMKNLTRIEPEPEVLPELAKRSIEFLSKDTNNALYDYELANVVRLLIHKVNELTEEVERMKGEQ